MRSIKEFTIIYKIIGYIRLTVEFMRCPIRFLDWKNKEIDGLVIRGISWLGLEE